MNATEIQAKIDQIAEVEPGAMPDSSRRQYEMQRELVLAVYEVAWQLANRGEQ
jgi:hypothetical protein